MAERLVLGGGDLSSPRIHLTVGDREGPGADGSGTGEVKRPEVVEVVGHGLGVAGGEKKADGAGEVGAEFVEVGRGFVLGVVAQSDGHDFGFAEEETVFSGG